MTDCEKYDFPLEHFIDKSSCNQETFFERQPDFDGRDTLIAINDTGVDPELYSMKVTTTGKRKLLDVIDCSGENDVNTSCVQTPKDGILKEITGRDLQVPEEFINPSNEYHLGVKTIFELFDRDLQKRIKELREKAYNSSNADALYGTEEKLEKHVEKNDLADKFERTDLLEEIEYLKKAKDLEDCGPVADIVVWNDGTNWISCLDTSYCGNLSLCTPMCSFRIKGEYSKISLEDQLTYSYRIASDGNLVQIVVPKGSHGSHVADIAAGYYPSEPKRNGLAPGAQILSIAWPKQWSSTDHGNILEALNFCKQSNVDIVNFSMKFQFEVENYGKFLSELTDFAYKNNIIVLKSAGNNGPGLCTVDSVAALDSTISVASYMSKNLKETVYSRITPHSDHISDYSSRGPSRTGSLSVSVCAPGAAMANLSRQELSNCGANSGTSMSAPYVAGVVACMLSGLKIQQKQWTPYLIKQAIENTAKTDLDNFCKLSCGQGLVQICEAFDYLDTINSKDALFNVDRFRVIVDNPPMYSRGIFVRSKSDQKDKYEINVVPKFKETDEGKLHHLEFERKFRLVSDRDWISTPENFFLAGAKHSFNVKIDYSAVPEGEVVYSEVIGIDSDNAALGPLFRIPITIINPVEVTAENNFKYGFTASISHVPTYRKFISVPAHANIMALSVRTNTLSVEDKIYLEIIQMEQHKVTQKKERVYKFTNDSDTFRKMVRPRGTLEIRITLSSMSSKKCIDVEFMIAFEEMRIPSTIVMKHSALMTKVIVVTGDNTYVFVKPEIALKKVVVPLKVTESKIVTSSSSTEKKSYQLLLDYKLETTGSCSLEFQLDEGMKCQMLDFGFMVFDSNNFYVYSPIASMTLEKGKYTIRVNILHEDKKVLKSLSSMVLSLVVKLEKEVKISAYDLPACQFEGELKESRNQVTWTEFPPNTQKCLYFRHVNRFSLPMWSPVLLSAGCYFLGTLLMGGMEATVEYYLDECSYVGDDKQELVFEDIVAKKSDNEEYEETIRDLEIVRFTKCPIPEKKEELYFELVAKYPLHLPLFVQRLNDLARKEGNSETAADRQDVITRIMDLCDPEKVQKFLGGNNTYADKRVKDEMEKNKATIIDTFKKKFTFIVDEFLLSKADVIQYFIVDIKKSSADNLQTSADTELIKPATNPAPDSGICTRSATPTSNSKLDEVVSQMVCLTEVDDAYMELLYWTKEDDILLLSAKQAICHNHYGRALSYLTKYIKNEKELGRPTKKEEEAMAEICQKMNWTHIADRIGSNILVKYPELCKPFKGNHSRFD